MSYAKRQSKLDILIKILIVALIVVGVVFVFKVVLSDPPAQPTAAASTEEDPLVIDEFKAGTYGGVKMDTSEDAVKYYVEAYNKTKAKTATYKTASGNEEWYGFIGEEELTVGDVMIDGKSNAVINKLVPGIVSGLFKPNAYGLPPCTNKVPANDIDEKSASFATSRLTAEDVRAVNVKDNGDGTITMQIQPNATEMSHRGMDAQGNFFNTLGAIDSTVDQISALSWAQGTTADNCKVYYKGGQGTVKIDTKTGEIVEADYDMEVTVDVTHANVAVITDKSATVVVSYKMHFPASDEYLSKYCEASRAN